ncbi:MAG: alpha/beta hydrolase [Lacisediminihabitans sp.]
MHEINQQIMSNVAIVDPSVQYPPVWRGLGGPVVDDSAAYDSATYDRVTPGGHPLQSVVSPWTVPSSGVPTSPSSTAGRAVPGAAGRLDASLLPELTGSALLDQLALLPRQDLARFVADNPKSLQQLLVNPPTARDVTFWWTGMARASKQSLLASAPALVGNLDGVPFGARDTANRAYLRASIADLKKSMKAGIGRGQLVTARARLHMLEQVQDTIVSKRSGPPRQLLTFDPAGYGRAAVVVGDLATADYVSYLVPGMFFTVDSAMFDWAVIAKDLYNEQLRWVNVLGKSDPSMAGKSVATVAWIGYQTPGLTEIGSLALADEGANLIGHAVEGVQSVRSGHEPFVTIIGHSYGSTAAMIELAKGGITVDALVLVGSPGSAAQSASELSVRNDNVYVGEAAWDPVVNTAFFGSDPGAPSFGARKMSVAGGVDVITHKTLAPAIGHLGYFGVGTEAMRNFALIGLNEGSLVMNGSTMDASRTLASIK